MAKYNKDDYELVEVRLKKFWKDYPEGRIETEIIHITPDGTCVTIQASVFKQGEDARPVATGIAQETKGQGGFANADAWMENCETSAIGRALANWKYQGSNKPRPSQEEMKKVQKSKPKQEVEKVILEESIKKFEDDIGYKKEEGKNAKQLNQVIAGFGFSKDVSDTYKAQAFKESKLSNDVESWTNDEMGKFLDLFEKATQNKTNPIEEVFGEVIETVIPTCPECNKSEWIEDNREKKQSNPEQFGNIPSWSCSTYKGNKGCGWVAWGDTDCPKEWL